MAPPALQQHAFSITDPLVPPFTLQGDFGKFLDLGSATTFPLTENDFTQTFSRQGMTAPYLQSWNVTLERQLTNSFMLSASYVGNKGTHLDGWTSVNQLPADKLGPDSQFGGQTAQQRRVYPNVFGLYNFENGGNSRTTPCKSKASGGIPTGYPSWLPIPMARRWTCGTAVSRTATTGTGSFGPTDTDLAHTFVYSYIWDMPWFKNPGQGFASHALHWVLGGWEANGIVTVRSGFPFTVTASDVSGSGGGTGSARPNRISDGELPSDERTITRWFDTTAFVLPANTPSGIAESISCAAPSCLAGTRVSSSTSPFMRRRCWSCVYCSTISPTRPDTITPMVLSGLPLPGGSPASSRDREPSVWV